MSARKKPKPVVFMFSTNKKNWNDSTESIQKQKISKITKSDTSVKIKEVDSFLLESKAAESGFGRVIIEKKKYEKDKLSEGPVVYVSPKHSNSGELAVLKITLSRPQSRIFSNEMLLTDEQVQNLPTTELDILQIIEDSVVSICLQKKSLKGCSGETRVRHKKLMRNPLKPKRKKSSSTNNAVSLSLTTGSETAPKDKVPWKYLKRATLYEKQRKKSMFRWLRTIHFHHNNILHRKEMILSCPNCTFTVTTITKHVNSVRTMRNAFALAPFGLCGLPYLMFLFKDVVHMCPFCNFYLGFCPSFKYYKSSEVVSEIVTHFRSICKTEKKEGTKI